MAVLVSDNALSLEKGLETGQICSHRSPSTVTGLVTAVLGCLTGNRELPTNPPPSALYAIMNICQASVLNSNRRLACPVPDETYCYISERTGDTVAVIDTAICESGPHRSRQSPEATAGSGRATSAEVTPERTESRRGSTDFTLRKVRSILVTGRRKKRVAEAPHFASFTVVSRHIATVS